MDFKKQAKRLCMTLLMSVMGLVVFAQVHKVSGVVVDNTGETIIGANVLEVGTSNGVITDIDGKFTINVGANAKLKVSYIGYAAQTITVGKQTNIKVTLQSDMQDLDEVVVVGYGVVKRRDLTGSVASIGGDKLAANPVADITQALQGQLPGVSVTSQDGRPGASMSIRIRGGGSITQSNDPLFIVDGVQVSSISDIPADNIESIDVLKDAASTAIYGARGANGVILVTTKGGKEGKANVKYNMYYQVSKNPELLETMDAYDMVLNTWSYATAYGDSYGDGVAKYYGLGSNYGNHLSEYKNVKTHNYINDLMRTASSWNHDLSISGGSGKTTYYATVNYSDNDGIRINSSFSRWNANFKLTQKINKKLNFDMDLRYVETEMTGNVFGNATSAYRYRPIDNPLGDPDFQAGLGQGDSNVDDADNPVANTNNYEKITKKNTVRGRGALTWTIVKGLIAKSELSLRRNWTETKDWDNGLYGYKSAALTNGNGYGVRWATTLNYEVQGLPDAHRLSFLLGNEVLASKSITSTIKGAGYPDEFTMNDAFGMINMTDKSLGKDSFNRSVGTPNHTNSFFGRANYSFMGKYLLTATFRADGSSKFAPENQWGYFPAAALAWRISDEGFMEDAEEWLNNLKLRLSYGTSGSDNIDASLWKETWKTSTITVDGESITTYVPGDMKGNPNLKWETTTSRNLGLDFGIGNRINGSIDAYWNSTDNILMKVPCDAASGYSYQFQNVGETSNKGIEVALNVDIIRKKDFSLGANLTYNFNKNKVEDLDENAICDTRTGWGSTMTKPSYDYIIRKGQPVGLIQGFKSDGFYTADDFDVNNGVWTLKEGVPDSQGIVSYAGGKNFNIPESQTAMPGMAKFKDVDGNGVIDENDATVIGKTMPQHTGGFNIFGNYRGLDFSVGFTYQIGGKVYNANAMHSMMGNKDTSFGANRLAFIADCYKIYDVNANGDLEAVTTPEALNALNKNAKYPLNFCENGLVSSDFVEDASYLRLNTLTLGYTLPKEWIKKVGISNCRVYFTGSNLFCLSGYSGIDPDVNTNASGVNGFPTPNYDYCSYPKARTFTFGLNLAF